MRKDTPSIQPKKTNKKLITDPELLLKYFFEYREWVKANPILVQDFVGKDGNEVYRKRQRSMSLFAFECYLNDRNIVRGIRNYFYNQNGTYGDFKEVCELIESYIKSDLLEGSLSYVYSSPIAIRILGLVDRTESDDTKEITINVKYEKKQNLIEDAQMMIEIPQKQIDEEYRD